MSVSNRSAINLLIQGFLILFMVTVGLPVTIFNHVDQACPRLRQKAFFILFVLLVGHFTVTAQGFKKFAGDYQMGLESTFGVKSLDIRSNIAEINNLHVQVEGGTVGVVIGDKSLVTKIRQGFYYSSAAVAHTVDESKSVLLLNFYPLHFFTTSNLRPYVSIGLERNIFSMRGFYGGNDQGAKNYSLADDPFLGKISTVQAGIGAGLEHRIKSETHFVAFFGEAKYCQPIRTTSTNQLFAETKLSGQLLLSVGISFGYHRK